MQKQKKLVVSVLFLIIFIILNSILGFALVKPGLTRVILHELESRDDYKCIILGTSHGSYGIDADIVSRQSGIKTMNLCIGGEYLQDSYYLLKRAFKTNNPDTIVLDIDFQYLVNVPKDSVSANFIYHSYPNSIDKLWYFKDKVLSMEFRATLFPWMDYRDNYSNVNKIIKTKLSSDYIKFRGESVKMEAEDEYKGSGFIYRHRNNGGKKDSLTPLKWSGSNVDKDSLEYLEKIMKLCKSNNTKVIMMTTPISVETLSNSMEEYTEAYSYLLELAHNYGIKYYNFSLVKENVFPRSLDDYWDYDGHLYGDSAERFSLVLGDVLKDNRDGRMTDDKYFHSNLGQIRKK